MKQANLPSLVFFKSIAAFILFLTCVLAGCCFAQSPGITAQEILLGQSIKKPGIPFIAPFTWADYVKAMTSFQPEEPLSYLSFEGYVAGRFFIEVIQGFGNASLDRNRFIEYIETTRHFDIGGLKLNFSHNLFMMRIKKTDADLEWSASVSQGFLI